MSGFKLAALASVWLAAGGLLAAEKALEPSPTWDGKLADGSLRRLEPREGFIADATAWNRLWQGWRPNEPAPAINFEETLILVATADGPNRVGLRPTIDDHGEVRFLAISTRIGGPGFGYTLAAIPRAGVTAVNGHPVGESDGESIAVEIVGVLRTGLVAIGGETTGTTITARGITWELDLQGVPALAAQATHLDGQQVRVRGQLEKKPGVEVRDRWIVTVTQLSPAKPRGGPTAP